MRIVDLDGDGWNDLVVVQQSFNKVATFRNNFGTFAPFSQAAVGTGPREMDIGDFDGDGNPDVAVLNRQSSDISILITYPGTAGFKIPENVYAVEGQVSGLEVRDFNNDGLADVVQFHAAAAEFSVRLAQPNGSLGAPTSFPKMSTL